jgi:tetratricopeptide (TPR) repeat protein
MKKTIIIFGNCQAQLIVACLDKIPFFREWFEVIWERNVDNPTWPARKELLQSQIKNCAYLFEQLGRKDTEFPHKDSLPSECVLIRYPYLKLQCLWPLVGSDPRNKPEPPRYGAGRFPSGDRIIIDWLEKNSPREKVLDEYMNLTLSEYVDLDQLHHSDLQRIREVDDKCDIKVYNLIEEQFRTKKLFSSFSHPTDEIFKGFLLEMLEKSGLTDGNRINNKIPGIEGHNLTHSIVIGVDTFFKRAKFDAVQVPIHPQVCQHFNLTWANGETRYQYYDYGHLTFKEYMRIYANYEGPEIEVIEKINTLLEAEKFEKAHILIERAIIAYPASPDFLNLKGQLLLQMGNIEEGTKIFSNILDRWPDNIEVLNNLAVVLCYEKKYDSAIKLLQRVLRINSANIDALENLKFIQNEVSILKAKNSMQKVTFSEAKKILERILDTDEQNVEALNQLAAIHISEDNFADAQKNVSTALAADPLNEETLKNLNTLQKKLSEYAIGIPNKERSTESLTKIKEVIRTRMTLGPNGPLPFINDEKKFVMFWMPRCGYTTSVDWFFGTLGLHDEIDTLYPELDLLFRVHRYAWEVWPRKYYGEQQYQQILESIVGKITDPDYYKFVIVRNPYSRIVSLFRGLMANPELFNILVPAKNEKISFAQFIDSLFTMNLYFCDFHLRYQTANICWGSGIKLDDIIELEQLSQGLDNLNRKFELNVPIRKLNDSKKFPRTGGACFAEHPFDDLKKLYESEGLPHYKSFYTPELKEKVYTLFKPDFETLGYTFDGKSTQTVSST